jgi:hypothetical protein
VDIEASLALKAVDNDTLVTTNVFTSQEVRFENVDTVVLALGWRANEDLYGALKGKVPELHRVGDCIAPRDIGMAFYSSELLGRKL